MSTTESGIGSTSLVVPTTQQQWYVRRKGCSGSMALFNPEQPDGRLMQQTLDKGPDDAPFRWRLELNVAVDNGTAYTGYSLISVATGMAVRFDTLQSAVAADVPAAQAAGRLPCLWTLTAAGDGYFSVNNYTQSQVLDAEGYTCDNGATILLWPWNRGDNQQWTFDEAP